MEGHATVTTLLAAIRRYEYNAALFDGAVHDGLRLAIAHYEGALLTAMRAMLRSRAYDLCEMSPSSYLIARAGGAPLVGLPIFPFCQYPLAQIVVREDSAVRTLQDLATATIVTRTWAQPTALWARQYLTDYRGIDLRGVRWMFVGEDPVANLARPAGSIDRRGHTLEALLLAGEADAAIGLHEVPAGCRQLIPDADAAAAQWTRDTGVVPANHLVVLDARQASGDVPRRVCERFEGVIRDYLAHGDTTPGVIGDLRRVAPSLPPLPSGRAANARMWTALVATMVRQGMLAPVADPLALLFDWEPAPR